MCRSPVFVVGYLVLVISAVACALSFAAPFWMVVTNYPGSFFSSLSGFMNQMGGLFTKGEAVVTEGLWGFCYDRSDVKTCKWYWENDFHLEKGLPDWHKAVQGLFGFGLLIVLLGVLLGSIHLCCCFCCKDSPSVSSTLASLCLSGALCIGSAIGVWGGFYSKEDKYAYAQFYWGFYIAIAGAVAAIVGSILFFCDSCRGRSHSGYHMTRVV